MVPPDISKSPFDEFRSVAESLTFADNNSRTGTFYYAPQLGTYVQATETITRPDGTVATVNASLVSSQS